MTEQEFNRWIKDYYAAFPETAAWVNNSPDPKLTLKHWRETLADVDVGLAFKATRRMHAGHDRFEPVQGFDREKTALIVRRYVGLLKAAPVRFYDSPFGRDRQPSYACLLCKDTGRLEIWSNFSMAMARRRKLEANRDCSSAIVRCSCEAGIDIKFPEIVFDARRMLPCPRGASVDGIPEIVEFMAAYGVSDADNFQPLTDGF